MPGHPTAPFEVWKRVSGRQSLTITGSTLVSVLLILPGGVWGQTRPEMEPARLFTSPSVEVWNAAESKDGRWIAFWGYPSPTRSSLYVVPAEGGDVIQLTQGPFNDRDPAWSPDGQYLYFNSDRTHGPEAGIYQVMRLPFDPNEGVPTGPPRVVSMDNGVGVFPPAISPDGNWVAFFADLDGPRPNISLRVVPAQGGPSRELARVFFGNFGWAGDGRHLYYSESNGDGETGLFQIPLEGGTPEVVLSFGEGNYVVDLSADGERILWSGPGGDAGQGSYKVTDRAGVMISPVDNIPGVSQGSLSFDGSSLLYPTIDRERSLVATPLQGGEVMVLKEGETSCSNESHGWTEDGRLFLVTTCKEGPNEGTKAYFSNPHDGVIEEVHLPLDEGSPGLIHPNGRHLRWTTQRTDEENPLLRVSDFKIIDLDTGETQDLPSKAIFGRITGPGGLQMDGEYFLYLSQEPDGFKAMRILPGHEPEALWTYPEDLISEGFRGTPRLGAIGVNGTRIAWVRSNYVIQEGISSETTSTLFVTDVATGITTELFTRDAALSDPIWSPDGLKIALNQRRPEPEGWKIAVATVGPGLDLVKEPVLIDDGDYSLLARFWTPDSKHLVESGIGVESAVDVAYFLVPTSPGAERINLAALDSKPWSPPSLSPDGTLLAYPSERLVGSSIWKVDLPGIGAGSGH